MESPQTPSENQTGGSPSSETSPQPPDYLQDKNTAYLAYILRETELIRARMDGMNRKVSVIVGLLAVAILVMIITWLDITGALMIF